MKKKNSERVDNVENLKEVFRRAQLVKTDGLDDATIDIVCRSLDSFGKTATFGSYFSAF